eukprot:TRINITY_DN29714_c0_g1_i1.p1 TRINITY_DN29714_c0_g1~~TRINITY_DN29714_c0_g1_i1.p1  ORF type:complete len:214 (+),score=25.87 TRINITY_DN29714_c0_g1_i1:77-718(+)
MRRSSRTLRTACWPQHGMVTQATPAVELKVAVPEGHQGEKIFARGPLGPVALRPPPGAAPGELLVFRLAPPAQFRVRVPPWAKPGFEARLKLRSGDEVSVTVPENSQPGDIFEALPPALMVLVPEGVLPGDSLVFRSCASQSFEDPWYRIRLPQGHQPGSYVSARLPPPSSSGYSVGGGAAPAPPAALDPATEEPLPRVEFQKDSPGPLLGLA